MVTLSVKEFDGAQRLLGSINKQPFNIPFSEDAKEVLISFGEKMEDVETVSEFDGIVTEAMKYIAKVSISPIVEVAGTDLMHDKEKNQYFLKVGDKVAKTPVPAVIVDRIQKAVDLGLDPSPWIKFWTRWMRNPDLSPEKTEYMTAYIDASFTDEDKVAEFLRDGYSINMAKELATFDQISITKEGLLAAFKFVRLKDTTKHVEIDKETGEQKIVSTSQSLTGKGSISVDANDKVIKTEGAKRAAEDLIFVPPVMGNSGSAFTCEPLSSQAKFEDYAGHVIRVGMRHRLESFKQMNCTDGITGGEGLHVGGYYYVQGFGGKTKLLVDCLVDPAHIGAFSNRVDQSEDNGESALRVMEYYVTGTHFAVNKSMYHPSAYAELLDQEWDAYKAKAIEDADKALGDAAEM